MDPKVTVTGVGYSFKTIAICCLVAFALGFFAGGWVTHSFFPRLETKTEVQKVPEVQEKVVTQTQTQVQYVPKETIHYITADGKSAVKKEDTDVQADIGQPKVNVKVNGQPYQFKLLQGENQKFEDGKVVMNQTSTVDFDLKLKPEVIDNTKHFGVGVIVSNKGAAPEVSYENKNCEAGVFYQPSFYGGRVELKF